MILGLILSFGTAISEALKDIFSKHNLVHLDEYTAAFSMHMVISILLAPFIMIYGIDVITERFLVALLFSSLIQLVVILLYLKSIKRSELSEVIPLVTLTPLFMLLTSPFIVGEFPNLKGLTGIALIVIGTYILNIKDSRKGFFAPFKNLIFNIGSRYMLIVAFLWSITANLDKIGVEETSPVFWAFTKESVIMLYLIPIMYKKSLNPYQQIKSRAVTLLSVGVFRTASVLAQMFAIQFILVAYVIAIKRSSALIIMLYAFFYLGENKNFKARFSGLLIIILGLAFIAFS